MPAKQPTTQQLAWGESPVQALPAQLCTAQGMATAFPHSAATCPLLLHTCTARMALEKKPGVWNTTLIW